MYAQINKLVSLTYGNLQIAPYELVSLQELTISKEMNHARLTLTGIVPEDKKENYVEMTEADTAIEVSQVDEHGSAVPLFHGIVLNVGIKAVRGVYYLEVEAVSHTYLLDVKKRKRSFQNHNMTYDQLLDLIAAEYPGFDVMDEATGGRRSVILRCNMMRPIGNSSSVWPRASTHHSCLLPPLATPSFISAYSTVLPRAN